VGAVGGGLRVVVVARLEQDDEPALGPQVAPDGGGFAFGASAQKWREVQAEDRVEAGVAEVGVPQRRGHDRGAAGLDMGAVAPPGDLGHLRRAVDGHDVAAVEALADERHGHAVTAAELQQPVLGLDVEAVHRPGDACRRPAQRTTAASSNRWSELTGALDVSPGPQARTSSVAASAPTPARRSRCEGNERRLATCPALRLTGSRCSRLHSEACRRLA
jgi:hypothetical protein